MFSNFREAALADEEAPSQFELKQVSKVNWTPEVSKSDLIIM